MYLVNMLVEGRDACEVVLLTVYYFLFDTTQEYDPTLEDSYVSLAMLFMLFSIAYCSCTRHISFSVCMFACFFCGMYNGL